MIECSFGVRPRDEKKPGGREVSQLICAICVICGSEYDRSVAHTTRGRDRRQEGGECSYYNLHCNLNKTLLHTLLLSFS